ncbi:TPA: hypothetical protein H1940_004769 [Salmonella enterica]|nr:hypothetical protein [Salmonella enterica]
MALYRTGTAAMDAQGVITGTGTKWREPLSLIRTGATIVFLTSPLKLAVISDIVSDTEMRAIQTDGEPVENGNYVILLNDSLTVDGMAQDVAETLRYYQSKETIIEEEIEFLKNLDTEALKDTAALAEASAQKTDADRSATEQLKNDTQTIADAAISELRVLKNATERQAKDIVDAGAAEITVMKDEALGARDEAKNAQLAAEQSRVGAEAARDEARQWSQQVQTGELLHKGQNLNDLADKVAARKNLNTPVGGLAIAIPNHSSILSFMSNYAESGYYSSSSFVTDLPPEVSDWWMFELHVRSRYATGNLAYGEIIATTMNGNKWGIICNGGYWGFWCRVSRSDGSMVLAGGDVPNSLGANSLVMGDSDTGLRWQHEGRIGGVANGVDIFAWDNTAFAPYRRIDSYSPDADHGMFVYGTRCGATTCLVGGKIQAGEFSSWSDRATGLLCEIPYTDAAISVFKVVYPGIEWVSGLDCVDWSSGGAETILYVKGSSFSFSNNGQAYCGQWVSTSDIRMKTHLKEIETASDKINYLTGYTYYKRNNLIEDESSIYSIDAGLIAQDVERVLPEAVHPLNNNGQPDPKGEAIKGINYNGVVALLVNAFKEQKAKVDKQQEEINTLRNELDELKKLVKSMPN